jgi:hypothetical protein
VIFFSQRVRETGPAFQKGIEMNETKIGEYMVRTWNEAENGSGESWKWTAVNGQKRSAEFGDFDEEAVALASAWQYLKDGNLT